MNFRWNFIFHKKLTSHEVILSHPETLKSYSFQREAFELMFERFPVSWNLYDFLSWSKNVFENGEEFHATLEKTRIVIPVKDFSKKISNLDQPELDLSLEEMALGADDFSQIKLTSVLREVQNPANFILTSDNALKLSSAELIGKHFIVYSLRELRFDRCTQVIANDEYQSVLDFGCGTGDLYQFLKNRNQKIQYTGFDSDAELIMKNQSVYGQSLFLSKFKDQKFELVVMLEVLEHMQLSEAKKLVLDFLVKGSDIFLTMPNRDFNKHFPNKPTIRHPDHIHEWSEGEFESFLEELREDNFEVQREDLGRAVSNNRPTLSAHIRSYRGHKLRHQSQ